MEAFELPAVPAGVFVLLGVFAPMFVAVVNNPRWSGKTKGWVSLIVTALLAFIVLALYYLMGGESIPEWPALIVLFVLVAQASYGLLMKPVARKIERSAGTGTAEG